MRGLLLPDSSTISAARFRLALVGGSEVDWMSDAAWAESGGRAAVGGCSVASTTGSCAPSSRAIGTREDTEGMVAGGDFPRPLAP